MSTRPSRRAPALPVIGSLLLAALLLVATAAPASAAVTVTATTPASGASLTGETGVELRVRRQFFDDAPTTVAVGLRRGEQQLALAELACTDGNGCDDTGGQPGNLWTGAVTPPREACNGVAALVAVVDGGQPRVLHDVVLARPPAAVTDLTVVRDGDEVTVSWTAAVEPDATLVVQRRRPGGQNAWVDVTELPPAATPATTATDEPGDGEWAYRVSSRRGDGLVDGVPAAPCEDVEPDLVASTEAVRVAPVAADDPSTGPTGGPSEDPSAGPSGEPTDGASGDPTDDASDGAGAGPGTGGMPDVGAPPPPRRTTDVSSNVSVAAPDQGIQRAEDGGFEELLDYSEIDPVTGQPRVAESGQGGVTAALGRVVERDSSRFVIVGVLLTAAALLLRRWRRGA